MAKTSWLLVTLGVIAFLFEYPWPIRLAMAVVTAANFESIAVTVALRQWRPDVSSLAEAKRRPEKSAQRVREHAEGEKERVEGERERVGEGEREK